jgi:hypothetical protein
MTAMPSLDFTGEIVRLCPSSALEDNLIHRNPGD